jgi:hypothetical protein
MGLEHWDDKRLKYLADQDRNTGRMVGIDQTVGRIMVLEGATRVVTL